MLGRGEAGRWIEWPRRKPAAPLRLFCFSYVGGNASAYREWTSGAGDVDVCPVQLPGRDKRLAEPPFQRLMPLVETLADVLPLERPFAFFGHSLGALVGFELARELRRRDGQGPVKLFVSAARPPQLLATEAPRHLLSDRELVEEVRRLGGTPEEVLRNAELMELFLPVLRADFAVADTYEYSPEAPLPCPIHAFGGQEDSKVAREDLLAWKQQTASAFALDMFPGGHFFLHGARTRLLRTLLDSLRTSSPGRAWLAEDSRAEGRLWAGGTRSTGS